jgi:two-component system sensor histidine kinase/response regulator
MTNGVTERELQDRQALTTPRVITIPLCASIISVLTGCMVLVGWGFGIEVFKRIMPSMVAMNPMTALAFILLGCALWLSTTQPTTRRRHLAQVCGAIVALVGLLKLWEAFLGWQTGIDRLLFHDSLDVIFAGRPSRMAPNTAWNFLLLGGVVLLLNVKTRRGHYPAQLLVALSFFASLLPVLGYLYGVKSFYDVGSFIPMALHTALAFLILCVGFLFNYSDRGMPLLMRDEGLAGVTIRRLLPAAIIIPASLGWLRLKGELLGLYELEMGTALLVVTNILAYSILVWWSAKLLLRIDASRLQRASELLRANELLKEEMAERSRVQAALDKSVMRESAMVENALDVICTIDAKGRFVTLNPACFKLWGYHPEELIGRRNIELVVPEDVSKTNEAAASIVSGKRLTNFENRYRHKNGSSVNMLSTAYWSDKEQLLFCVARDNTERKRAEAAVGESRAWLAAIFDASRDGILVEENDQIIYANNALASLYGYESREEMIGQNISHFRAGDDDQRLLDLKRQRVAGEDTPTIYEFRGVRKDSTLFDLEISVSSFQSSGKTFTVSLLRDITLRKQREEKLAKLHHEKESQAVLLTTMFSAIPDFIYIFDREGRFAFANQGLLDLLGVKLEEAVGKNFFELNYPEELATKLQAQIEYVFTTQEGITDITPFTNPSGKDGVYEYKFRPVLSSDGSVEMVVGATRDITEHKELANELKHTRDAALESARLKSEFLANMSHEIRTPMNGLLGMTDLLLDTDLSDYQRDFAETIQTSADSLLKIIDDILDFSKIESGLLRFEKIDFDLRQAVEATLELLAERAQAKGLELATLVYHDVPTSLRGDPGRLRQVLTNLIGNAVKFTERGEVVVNVTTVGETASQAMLRFEIKDTGIGISTKSLRRLFLPFVQADGSTTRKYGGTGLGLAISKQLVELMDGEIGVESAPGLGSTFWFTGSFEKQPEQVVTKTETAGAVSLEGARVLIVDDNATNRKILLHQTTSWGMIAAEAESGPQARESLQRAATQGRPYDIAILDLMMPGMDGFQLAKEIKNDRAIAGVRLVLLTSYGKRGDGETARQSGISAYLNKPVRQKQLSQCLIETLSQPPGSETLTVSHLITRHSLQEIKIMPLEQTALSAVSILIVEDSLVNQIVALGHLKNLGYQAKAVPNGLEALKVLETERFDIILMDCQMPEMDGFEATAAIRRREGATRHTTIIAMTANALEGDRQKCLAAGMDDYLSKPFRSDTFRQMIEQWIKPTNGAAALREQSAPDASALPAQQPSAESKPVKSDRNGAVDLSVLAAYREIQQPGKPDFVTELIDLFLKETSAQLVMLHESISGNDADELLRVAHLLKGSSGNIGAGRIASLAQALEEKGIEGQAAETLLEQLEREFGRVRTALVAERVH